MFSMRRATVCGAVIATAGVLALGACTAEAEASSTATETPAGGSSATPTPSPDPTAAAIAAAAADEKLLPLPVDEIGDWAKAAVPGSETEGHQTTYSGWLSDHSSPRLTNTDQTIDPGTYQVQIACRGEGTITVTVHPVDTEPGDASAVCQNGTIAFEAATSTPGFITDLALEGEPSIYAMSFVSVATP